MYKILMFLFLSLVFISSLNAQKLEEEIQNLSDQIASEMSTLNKKKIAVVEFSDLDGKITELGKYLSEELITRLFKSKKFSVIERHLLNKVMQEHHLNFTGIIDETTAKELGKILGVDAICSGTITDLVNSVKINARLIDTETGTLFSVASIKVEKDEVVNKLIGKVSYVETVTSSGKKDLIAVNGNIVYYEDFSNIQEGLIPNGWLGGNTLSVTKSKDKKDSNILCPFQTGQHYFTIPNLNFPDNFKLEVEMYIPYPQHSYDPIVFNIGNLSVGLDPNGDSWLGDAKFYDLTRFRRNPDKFRWIDTIIIIKVEKIGPVFRLYINGREFKFVRIPNFKNPESISFKYNNDFRIYKIVLYQL